MIIGNQIQGGTISGVTLNVNTDATIGKNLYLLNEGHPYVVIRTAATTNGQSLIIGKTPQQGGVASNLDRVDMLTDFLYVYGGLYVSGFVDFRNATVMGLATEEWVMEQINGAINGFG